MDKITFSTDRQVANLKPLAGQSRTDYYHKTEKGLILRITARKKSWKITYSINDKRKYYTLPIPYPQCSLADAVKECQRIRTEAMKGNDPMKKRQERKASPTIGDVMALYIKEVNLLPDGKNEAQRVTDKEIIPLLGSLKAQDLKRQHIKDLHALIVDRGSPVMANRTVELMQRAFSHAFEEEFIKTNTFPSLRKIKAPETTRERVLTEGEIAILWRAMGNLKPNMRDIHKLLLLTGQRTKDVCGMKICDIDPARKEWTVPAPPRGKNRNPNVLPLCPLAWEVIEPRLQQESEWMFPSAYNTTRKGFRGTGHAMDTKPARRSLIEETGVKDWTGHDLRRTLRTLLSQQAIPPHIAERIIGHVQGGVEGIYDRYTYVEEKKKALLKIDRLIRKIVGLEQQEAQILTFPRVSNGDYNNFQKS